MQLIFKSKTSFLFKSNVKFTRNRICDILQKHIDLNYSEMNARSRVLLKCSHECIKQLIQPRKYKTTKTMYPKPQPTMY